MNDVGALLLGFYEDLVPLFTAWGMKVLGGLAVLIVGLMLARSVRRGLAKVFDRTEMDQTLERFLSSLIYYLILIMTGVAALGMMGIQMASVLTMAHLLENLGRQEAAVAIERAVCRALEEGVTTADLGGGSSTSEVGDFLVRAIGSR